MTKPPSSPEKRRHCVVVGGGVAGISAACELAERGVKVTLIERRNYLGGRSFSFPDRFSGRHIDNGQHIYLTSCTAYMGFLRRLGALGRTRLQSRLRAVVQGPDGRRGALTSAPLLPAPLHLLPCLLGYPHLPMLDRLRIVRTMITIMRTDRARHRDALEAESFREWLERHGQSSLAISRFWDLLALPVFNDTGDTVSAYMGLMFFQVGMLADRHSADIGVSTVGMTELVGEAARRYIEARGGEVRMGRRVAGVTASGGMVTGVMVDGVHEPADAVITATPWDTLDRLLPKEIAALPAFANAAGIQWSPIINVHVWYDRPVVDEPFLAVLDSPLQWVFNLSAFEGSSGLGQHVCACVSGAWEYVSAPADSLRELFLDELERAFPAAKQAGVEHFRVVRQVNSTFRCTPEGQALRPTQQTPVPGLALAGDWTQTGWPSTMESAVRSGLLAAEAVTRQWAANAVP